MRLCRSAAVASAGLAALSGLGGAGARAAVADQAPARLQVGADEFRYTLSRLRLPAGAAVIQLVNYGEDDHNLRLRREGGKRTKRLPRTAPGEMSELRTFLRAGRFKLWCSLPGHEGAGMKAGLRVVKRS
jgi:hypothetical protein